MRVLNGADVRRLLPMKDCIDLMRQAFRVVSDGGADQPIRRAVWTSDKSGLLSLMPGHIAEPALLGVKLITVFPNATGVGSHQGLVVLFDARTGAPLGIADAAEITAIRTAAATAAATDVLARPDARTLSVLGTGEQARSHLEALPLARPFERVLIWGRDGAKAQGLRDWAAARLNLNAEVAATAQAAAAADVICTVTAAPEPILEGAWLRPGAHVNVVGSSIPSTSEIDVETVVRARVYVDYRASALELAGDLRRAFATGGVGESHVVGEVGQVLNGTAPGRRSPDEITLFKSLGMAAEDLLCASWLLERAERSAIGQTIAWE